MSNNTKIFSEAIAEAKAIRETAMANAKLALEEAFAPRIQEMMSDKLEAMSQEEDEMKEDYGQAEADAVNDEISLEELLAELEGIEEYGDEHAMSTKGALGDDEEKMEENTIAEAEDDDEVGTISVDELKDIIRDIMADVMGGGEEEEAGEEEMEAGEEEMEAGEDDLELEEILAEIANLEEGDVEEGKELNEMGPEYLAGAKDLVEMFPFLNMTTASLVIGALGAAGLTAFSAITAKVMDMALAGRFGASGKAFAEKSQSAGGAATKARNNEGKRSVAR